eukprot:336648-Amphidinium_carterae.1
MGARSRRQAHPAVEMAAIGSKATSEPSPPYKHTAMFGLLSLPTLFGILWRNSQASHKLSMHSK